MTVTKHYVEPLKDGIQKCTLCGEIISDYRNVLWDSTDGTPPKGFAEGNVFISYGNPTIYYTDTPEFPLPKDLVVKECTKVN